MMKLEIKKVNMIKKIGKSPYNNDMCKVEGLLEKIQSLTKLLLKNVDKFLVGERKSEM